MSACIQQLGEKIIYTYEQDMGYALKIILVACYA